MDEQQLCEMLKEIIPELEANIRNEMRSEYEQKIADLHEEYREVIETINRQFNQQLQGRGIQAKNQEAIDQIYKRVAVLEAQRRNWGQLEQQYRKTIAELTDQLISTTKTENNGHMSKSDYCFTEEYESVGPVHPPPVSMGVASIAKWNKSKNTDRNTVAKDPTRISQFLQMNAVSNKQQEDSCLNKYLGESNLQYVSEDHNKTEHYTSVLSPPKQQSRGQAKKLFWDEAKKKQLLSLIKL